MSALTDAIARLESGGSSINGPSGGYANYRYQQFGGFVNQYGFGEAGINNYASQVLQANPSATFGDLYGGYVTGTGNPAAASMSSLLTTTQPGAQGAYSNLINNSPISPDTPLSSLIGSDNASNGIWSSGTNALPYSGSIGGDTSIVNGSGPGIGYLGQTSDLGSAYSYGNSGYVQSDANGNFVTVPNAGTDVGSTAAFGADSFTGGNFDGSSGSSIAGTDANGNVDISGGSMPELSTGYPYNAPLTGPGSVDTSSLFSGIGSLLGGAISGNSSNSGGSDFFAWLGDWAIRGAVIILGFIFVIAGLFLLKGNMILAPELSAALEK